MFYLSRKLTSMEKVIPLQKTFHEKSTFMKNLAVQWGDDYQYFKEIFFFYFVKGLKRIHILNELVNLYSNFTIRLLFAKIYTQLFKNTLTAMGSTIRGSEDTEWMRSKKKWVKKGLLGRKKQIDSNHFELMRTNMLVILCHKEHLWTLLNLWLLNHSICLLVVFTKHKVALYLTFKTPFCPLYSVISFRKNKQTKNP